MRKPVIEQLLRSGVDPLLIFVIVDECEAFLKDEQRPSVPRGQ